MDLYGFVLVADTVRAVLRLHYKSRNPVEFRKNHQPLKAAETPGLSMIFARSRPALRQQFIKRRKCTDSCGQVQPLPTGSNGEQRDLRKKKTLSYLPPRPIDESNGAFRPLPRKVPALTWHSDEV